MFSIQAIPTNINSLNQCQIKGSNGTPPYSITASGLGSFVQTDTEGGIYTPIVIPNTYLVIFWAKDQNNALARCTLQVN